MSDYEYEDDDDDYEYEYEYEYEWDDPLSMEEEDESEKDSLTCTMHNNNHVKKKIRPGPIDNDSIFNPSAPPSTTVVNTVPAHALLETLQQQLHEVVEALGVPLASSAPLLRCYDWSLQALLQAYATDSDRVLEKAGVAKRVGASSSAEMVQPTTTTTAQTCLICWETLTNDDHSLAMPCGHEFCLDCWHEALVHAIDHEGSTCVAATCPQADCTEVVTEVEVKAVAPELLSKYQLFVLASFVESNKLARWCPGKGCERVAFCANVNHNDNLLAHCKVCEIGFCVSCGDEPHAPATCSHLTRWTIKCQDDSETANYMTANTKTCPKCVARIEKNGGCQYITCRKCGTGFCWVCGGTHHVHQCNAYNPDNDDPNKDRAKNELERYLHYYQRYKGHSDSQAYAEKQLARLKRKEENDSSNVQDLRFLLEANQQLIECRRLLKFTYVFAYYRFDDPSSSKQPKECFEHHQGILEGLTEGLSKATETEPETGKESEHMVDVINRTRVIGRFIKNVLDYVENVMVE